MIIDEQRLYAHQRYLDMFKIVIQDALGRIADGG